MMSPLPSSARSTSKPDCQYKLLRTVAVDTPVGRLYSRVPPTHPYLETKASYNSTVIWHAGAETKYEVPREAIPSNWQYHAVNSPLSLTFTTALRKHVAQSGSMVREGSGSNPFFIAGHSGIIDFRMKSHNSDYPMNSCIPRPRLKDLEQYRGVHRVERAKGCAIKALVVVDNPLPGWFIFFFHVPCLLFKCLPSSPCA